MHIMDRCCPVNAYLCSVAPNDCNPLVDKQQMHIPTVPTRTNLTESPSSSPKSGQAFAHLWVLLNFYWKSSSLEAILVSVTLRLNVLQSITH